MPVPLSHFPLSLCLSSVAFNPHNSLSFGSKDESLKTSVLRRPGVAFAFGFSLWLYLTAES